MNNIKNSWKHKFIKSLPKPIFIIFIEKQRCTADLTNVLLISHLVKNRNSASSLENLIIKVSMENLKEFCGPVSLHCNGV